jgi:beta-glucosidase
MLKRILPALAFALAAHAQPYLDPRLPVEERVRDLLARMTLEEKVGQMNMPCGYLEELGRGIPAKIEASRRFAAGTLEKGLGPGGGFFTLPNNVLPEGPRRQAEFLNELQRIAVTKTRLRIPLLQTEEGTHGLMCSGGTIFPEGPGLGSTWDLGLIRRVYEAAAREARAIGVHQLFTLVVEPIRDPRLGRNQEAYSEDPWFCARYAETITRAVQGADISAEDKVVAGLCHYPGQSQPVSGLERGAMEISERTLRSVFLPPWVAGIRRAGALGVMATYPAIDGVPAHASGWLLTKILREELGFEGLVLGEGSGLSTLVYEGLAADQKQAGALALRAGVDVGISYEPAYMQPLVESVREGLVPMEWIDRAVSRILRLKFRLGLFERPYVDPERAERVVHSQEHQELALEAARKSIVLLKNDGNVLPLRKDLKSIAVIGPNADDWRNLLGDYTARKVLQPVITVLEGVRQMAPGARIEYVRGCDIQGERINEIEKAREAARRADAAIVVVGENAWDAAVGNPTNGEGYDVASLDLTGLQEELVKAVHSTRTPTIVVLVNGRPLSIRWIAENVPAIVEAWLPGEKGGRAVAEVLFGDVNPSGRLPVTVPRHSGQLPVTYDRPPSKDYWIERGWGRRYADMSAKPLWEFGHGLSYTSFEYSNLRIETPRVRRDGEVRLSVDVANTGARAGAEVVQLYIRGVLASVTTPVKQLRGFERVELKPGEKKTVRFTLRPEDLSLLDRSLKPVVEPGEFRVMIGRSSEDIRLRGSFVVTE